MPMGREGLRFFAFGWFLWVLASSMDTFDPSVVRVALGCIGYGIFVWCCAGIRLLARDAVAVWRLRPPS